jgi:hypothetical protein
MPDILLSVSPSATEPVARTIARDALPYALCGAMDVCGSIEKTRAYRRNPCDRTKRACVMLHPGGTFTSGAMASAKTLETCSNLAAIDIDHGSDGRALSVEDCAELRKRLESDRHVRLLAPSMSGKLWGLVALEGERAGAWRAASAYFAQYYAIDVGSQGDIRRGRFLVADAGIDDVVMAESSEPFIAQWEKEDEPAQPEDWTRSTRIDLTREELAAMLAYIDPFCDMVEWVRRLGCIKAQLGEDGAALAEKWSRGELMKEGLARGHSHYDDARFQSAWRSLKRQGATAKTLVMLAHAAGYQKHAPDVDPKTLIWTERTAVRLKWHHDFVMRDNGKVGFVHVPTRKDYSSEGLDLVYGRYLLTDEQRKKGKVRPAIAPSDVIANVLRVPTIGDDVFRPGMPALIEEHGKRYLNLWQEDGPAPVGEADWSDEERADVQCMKDHLDWLLGPEHARILVAFLAMVVQRVGRVQWCPLLVGPDGCGKTIVAKMMRAMLGRNATQIDAPSVMTSQFNDFAAGHEFAALEEVKSTDKPSDHGGEVLDKMKPLITNEYVTWHRKGKPAFSIENMQTYFASTNHTDALKLTSNDRRWCPLRARFGTQAEYRANLDAMATSYGAYFARLHLAVERSPAAMRGWLAGVRFEAGMRFDAPQTEDRAEMIAINQSDLDTAIDRYLARTVAGGMPADQGKPILVNVTELKKHLSSEFNEDGQTGTTYPNLSGQGLARRIIARGYRSLGNSIYWNGQRNLCFAILMSHYDKAVSATNAIRSVFEEISLPLQKSKPDKARQSQ